MKTLGFLLLLALSIAFFERSELSAAESYYATEAYDSAQLASTLNAEFEHLGSDQVTTDVDGAAGPVGERQLAQQSLATPSGRVLLTISGAIGNTNTNGMAKFDRQMLLKLGTSTIRTSTSWTDGVSVFEGVRASEVMRAVGARGSTAFATALNDYVVEIPIEDFEKYGVVFALSRDGEELSVRDKGPIWTIYPRDDFPELRNRASDKKWIWQLVTIDIR